MLKSATSVSEKAFILVGLFLSVLYMAGGLAVWMGIGAGAEYRSLWGLVGMAAGVAILLGIRMQKRSPVLGAFLAFGGAVPLAVVLAGTMLPPVLAVFMLLTWAHGRWMKAKSHAEGAEKSAA